MYHVTHSRQSNWKKGNVSTIIVLLWFLSFSITACKETPVEILTVTNELSFCEESNVFWKIYNDSNTVTFKDRDISNTVFLKFNPELNDSNYYSIFFPNISNARYMATIQGRFETDKLYDNTYGCLGSSVFKVEKVLSLQDVTKKYDFQINYME